MKLAFLLVFALFALASNVVYADYENKNGVESGNEFWRFHFSKKYPSCGKEEDCLPEEFCEKRKKSVNGKCTKKFESGEYCLKDEQCAAEHCHWYRCKGKQEGKNVEAHGPCNNDEDCHHRQYCRKRKCSDRKENGWCSSDSQCYSNHCSWFRCVKQSD